MSPVQCPMCLAAHANSNAAPAQMLKCEACNEVFEVGPPRSPNPSTPAQETCLEPSQTSQPKTFPFANRDRKISERDQSEKPRSVAGPLAAMAAVVLFLLVGLGGFVWLIVDRVDVRIARTDREEISAAPSTNEPGPSNEPMLSPSTVQPAERPEKSTPSTTAPVPSEQKTPDAIRPKSSAVAPAPLIVPQPPKSPNAEPTAVAPPKFAPSPSPKPKSIEPVLPPEPELPRFDAPVNPYRAGTQTTLRELRAVDLPAYFFAAAEPKSPRQRPKLEPPTEMALAHATKGDLLFVRTSTRVWVYDLKAAKEVGIQGANAAFTDMCLTPDESALFVADFGGERTGYGTPIQPSQVHRFDLTRRKWDQREAPKIAYRIEAVDSSRVLLLEQDQHVDVTLNQWEVDGVGVRELARIASDYRGDMAYDPRTGRLYHGTKDVSPGSISLRHLSGNTLRPSGLSRTVGATGRIGGVSVVLSQDGSRFYYGKFQFDAADLINELQAFPEAIVAASRDVAFGTKSYYRATTGAKLGDYSFQTSSVLPTHPFYAPTVSVVVVRDGSSVWAIDWVKQVARQFALEGEKK